MKSWVLALLEVREMGERIPFINIYASMIYREKSEFWDSLEVLKERNLHLNSVMGGDFNTILNNAEKRGGTIVRNMFRDRMEDIIDSWDTMDINHKSGKYMWPNR